MNFLKKILPITISVVILIFLMIIAQKGAVISPEKNTAIFAKVIEITGTDEDVSAADNGVITQYVFFKAKVLNGTEKGISLYGYQLINNSSDSLRFRQVQEGDKVFLDNIDDNGFHLLLYYDRVDTILLLGAILVIFLLLFGRTKGLKTTISLLLTIIAIVGVFIPSILSQQNTIIWGIIVALYSVISTITILNGLSLKSISSIIGCIGGILVIIMFSLAGIYIGKLTGALDSAVYLKMSYNNLNFQHILLASFLIGAIGAVMDVAVELSSSLFELRQKAKDHSPKSLIKSGIQIGRDMIGTMSNTLVLAYVSSSLVSITYLATYNYETRFLISSEVIASEIIQILVGSLGILFTIPITIFVCAYIYNIDFKKLKNKKRTKKKA